MSNDTKERTERLVRSTRTRNAKQRALRVVTGPAPPVHDKYCHGSLRWCSHCLHCGRAIVGYCPDCQWLDLEGKVVKDNVELERPENDFSWKG